MDIEQWVNDGDIKQALEAVTQDVKAAPAAASPRIALFQLLSINGQWQRAIKQLTVLKQLDDDFKVLEQSYGSLLSCELFRQGVFAGKHVAPILGQPEQWMVLVLEALKADAAGRHDQAIQLREEAFGLAPALAGHVNDDSFAWLADADSRIGPFFEIMVRGDYYWVPQARIESLTFESPTDVRDLVWAPVSIVWQGGGEEVGFVPARYPGDTSDWSAAQQFARETAWAPLGEDTWAGIGQRLYATSDNDYSALDVRTIAFAADQTSSD